MKNSTSEYKAMCVIIGENIRIKRRSRRFSVKDLACHLNLSESYIGLLERGERCPSMKIIFQICKLFNISPNDLLISEAAKSNENNFDREAQHDAVSSLCKLLTENETEFIIDSIKNIMKIRQRGA